MPETGKPRPDILSPIKWPLRLTLWGMAAERITRECSARDRANTPAGSPRCRRRARFAIFERQHRRMLRNV